MGVKIDFESFPFSGSSGAHETIFNRADDAKIDNEIKAMLRKGIIKTCERSTPEFISRIFSTPKKDGSLRLILNLENLNKYVEYHHFKMDTINTVVSLMEKNCFMASIDLKDAYYTVRVDPSYQNYLKFQKNGQLYAYTCLPNGLSSCPRIFTKLFKLPLAELREMGFINSAYIDDLYLQGSDCTQCFKNITETLTLFDKLGFVIHPDKSQILPSQEIVYLGFILNSVNMTIKVTPEKVSKITDICKSLLKKKYPKIRDVAKCLGMMVSNFPGVRYGPLHYRNLEFEKIEALKSNCGNYEKTMIFSDKAIFDLNWWIENISSSFSNIILDKVDATLYTDASKSGWGAVLGNIKTYGHLTNIEKYEHINYLELLAVLFGLKSICKDIMVKHIRLMIDNSAAVHMINNMGTVKSKKCNILVNKIWNWAICKDIWLSAAHLPGKQNVLADKASRESISSGEWMLNKGKFALIMRHFNFQPEIDLFASRNNYQISLYVSYLPDPYAIAIDAFSVNWNSYKFYAFPPFSLINKVIQKIQSKGGTGILVVPDWPTQTWFPKYISMLTAPPLVLKHSKSLLSMPESPGELHPLYRKMSLLVGLLSVNSN